MIDCAEFDAIYVKYKGQIRKYCYLKLGSASMGDRLAEEAADDVFMVLYEKWDSLDRGDGLRAWLYRTAENVVKNKARAERRRAPDLYIEEFAVKDGAEALAASDVHFEDDVTEEKFAGHMRSVLDDDDFSLYKKRFIDKKTYDDIAAEESAAYSTVRRRSLKLETAVRREIRRFAEENSE